MTPEEIEKLIKLHVEKLRKQLQKEIKEKVESSLNEHEERYEHERRNDPWY